eukprot:scaffold43369_cov47-Phaeocystis_antarctica.AAC.1
MYRDSSRVTHTSDDTSELANTKNDFRLAESGQRQLPLGGRGLAARCPSMAYMGRLPSLYIGRLAKGLARPGDAAQASSSCTWLGLGLGSGFIGLG